MHDKRRAVYAVAGLGVATFLMLVPHSAGRVLRDGGIVAKHPEIPVPAPLPAPQDSALLPSADVESAALTQPNATHNATETVPERRLDITGLREAMAAYKTGNLTAGDEEAKKIVDPLAATLAEWTALRAASHEAGYDRLTGFVAAHADWPGNAFLLRKAEEELYCNKVGTDRLQAYFTKRMPLSTLGKLALARLRLAVGQADAAGELVREVWRKEDLPATVEAQVRTEFGGFLRPEDTQYRVSRLLYKEDTAAALRSIDGLSPDFAALAKARAAILAGAKPDDALAAVPAPLRTDAGLVLVQAQKLRRADQPADAAQLLLTQPRDVGTTLGADEWWQERRQVARKLLDAGDAVGAYKIVATHGTLSLANQVDAEFMAGWIALRFRNDAQTAVTHFDRVAAAATLPISRARASYWQGRAHEALNGADDAKSYYETAAHYPTTYYGQLAVEKVGLTSVSLPKPEHVLEGDARAEATRAVELLYALGENDAAQALSALAAETLHSEDQLTALAAVTSYYRDAHATLTIGKNAAAHGLSLDTFAFPAFGIPAFAATPNSADPAIVYAIARQESAFLPSAKSPVGARGLMQLMPATAQRTAVLAGLGFDADRLMSDPAYNAQIGASHLGELLGEQGGSYILTFAAYNAGGKHVKDWINAYGDPRNPNVDPIDWVERIPFAETRNYVQRVMENFEIYRMQLGEDDKIKIGADLRKNGKVVVPEDINVGSVPDPMP
ncbi:lytic transglycosylase domain-containing protein [Methylovirgula sp. 4M-Z18]|uniref:lytic transglycosylase domain-containing protein n=1 Tax=Methylovirgula sp. 4M-Z18 TaxID=2293567 RepID=UPI0011C075A3|nr:lytic transglycosylase domain-containing protein [Methylovirgula sp. 4M-Z18]